MDITGVILAVVLSGLLSAIMVTYSKMRQELIIKTFFKEIAKGEKKHQTEVMEIIDELVKRMIR